MTNADKTFLAVLSAFFVTAVISPFARSAFPVNDDWTQTVAVLETITRGHVFYPVWLSAYSYLPIGYGIVLVRLFGFSFWLLRATTIAMAFGSIAIVYAILRRRGIDEATSVAATVLMAANPIFFFLTFTFQTDVPTVFFLSLAFLLYIVASERDKTSLFFAGSVAAIAAFLTRQIGAIALLAAAVIACGHGPYLARRITFAFAFPLAAGLLFVAIAATHGYLPGEGSTHYLTFDRTFPGAVLANAWQFALLISLLVAPASVSVLVRNRSWFKERGFQVAVAIAAVASVVAVRRDELLTDLGNIITSNGLGPTSTVLQGDLVPMVPHTALQAMTVALTINFVVWIYALIRSKVRDQSSDRGVAIVALFGLVYLASVLIVHPFDRYLLALYPVVIVSTAIVMRRSGFSKPVFVILVALTFVASFIGTSVAFSWRAALWRLGERLVASGVGVRDIEGGYEWDGYNLYAAERTLPLGDFTPTWAPWYVRDLFPGHGMRYILSFSPLGGYKVVDSEAIRGLPIGPRTIYANEIVPKSLEDD